MLNALQTGPIVCGISLPYDLKNWTGNNIYRNPLKAYYAHDVSIVGYHKTARIPYWIVRNSWGESWGYGGFFNVEMGKGVLGIELLCRTFTPIQKTDPNTVKNSVMKKAWKKHSHKQILKTSIKLNNDRRLTSLELNTKYMRENNYLTNHSSSFKGYTKPSWEDTSLKNKIST
jgi:Fe-S cluster biosynthesis and repair protein YggX